MCFVRYSPLPEPRLREHIPIMFPALLGPQEKRPRILEIGPGRGDYLFYLAEKSPAHTVVAVEIKPQRVDKIVNRIQQRALKNVCIIEGDGRKILQGFLNEHLNFVAIHINFPDPWPKNTQRKNRLVTEEFLQICANLLEANGKLHFATDVDWYAEMVAKLAGKVSLLQTVFPEVITQNAELVFPTFFHEKWKRIGRKTYYQEYRKSSSPL